MNGHILSIKTYVAVFAALLALLAATIAVAHVNLGAFNAVFALTIAVAKALLVILFFMHARYSGRLVWIYAGIGFFWLAILMALTLGDFLTRAWLPFASR
jgi:cytochrome c oxidase subunit IV